MSVITLNSINNEELLETIKSWRNWHENFNIIHRSFENLNSYKKLLDDFVLAFVGVRRSGKTMLSLQIAKDLAQKNFFYMNFEDPFFKIHNQVEIFDHLIKVFTMYFGFEPEILVFDEIYHVDSWHRWVRKIIDTKKYKIIITGSSAEMLSSELSTSLTGRVIEKHVYPLSFGEYLSFLKIKPKSDLEYETNFYRYMKYGAFPQIVLAEEEYNKRIILQNYFKDIIQKDIVERYAIRNYDILEKIALYYMTNISSPHSYNKVAKAFNSNPDTAQDYSRYLKSCFAIFELLRFHPNLKVQDRDSRKVYCIDTGLRNANTASFSEDIGKQVENIVLVELMRRKLETEKIFYSKEKHELDFVVTENCQTKTAIQVSYSNLETSELIEREIGGLNEFLENHNVQEALLLTKNLEIRPESSPIKINPQIRFMPIWKFLLNSKI